MSTNNIAPAALTFEETMLALEAATKPTSARSYNARGAESAMPTISVSELELFIIRPYYSTNRLRSFLPTDHPSQLNTTSSTPTPFSKSHPGALSAQEQKVRLTIWEMARLNDHCWATGKRDRLLSLWQGKSGQDLDDWMAAAEKAATDYARGMKERAGAAESKKAQ